MRGAVLRWHSLSSPTFPPPCVPCGLLAYTPMESPGSAPAAGRALLKGVLLAGLVGAVAVLLWRRGAAPGAFAAWMFWLVWPAMALHQCEEHVFAEGVLGRRYAFLDWIARVGFHLTARQALALNVGLGWTMGVAAGLLGTVWPVLGLFAIAVEAVNGFWHLSAGSIVRSYSPGAATGVLVTVPVAFLLFHQALTLGLVTWPLALAVFFGACLSHHLYLTSLRRMAGR